MNLKYIRRLIGDVCRTHVHASRDIGESSSLKQIQRIKSATCKAFGQSECENAKMGPQVLITDSSYYTLILTRQPRPALRASPRPAGLVSLIGMLFTGMITIPNDKGWTFNPHAVFESRASHPYNPRIPVRWNGEQTS
jgi:hypothetical protein